MTNRKHLAISALQKSVFDSYRRYTFRRFSANFSQKSAISVRTLAFFYNPFGTHYIPNASNSPPALVLLSISIDLAPPLSLCCFFLACTNHSIMFLSSKERCFFIITFYLESHLSFFNSFPVTFLS